MAQRPQESRLTWRAVVQSMQLAAEEADKKRLELALASITPREIYEAQGMMSALPTTLISGHIRFALQHFDCQPMRDLRKEMTDCLVDGFVLYRKISPDDQEPKQEDPAIIDHCDWASDELKGVWIKYTYLADVQGNVLDNPEPGTVDRVAPWVYEEHVYRQTAPVLVTEPELGTIEQAFRRSRRYPLGKERDFTRFPWSAVESIDFFPYIAIRWAERRSILAPIKVTILRYETALLNIATENNRHARRKMVGRGTGHFAKTAEEYNDEGRMTIPQSADIFYPDTHPDGIQPMFKELELLEGLLRDNAGLIKVADLHNASGSSRQFEVAPNMSMAEMIRDTCVKIMQATCAGDDFLLSFYPLVQYDPSDIVQLKKVYDEMLVQAIITPEEHASRMRFITKFRRDETMKSMPMPAMQQQPQGARLNMV